MLKKITSVILVLTMCMLSICPTFAIATEDASKYLTREEFEKEISKLENDVDTMRAQYKKGVWHEVLKIFDNASTSPYSAGIGVNIATSSGTHNLQWTITKVGEKVTAIPSAADGGIDTTRTQLMYMTPKNSKKSYVAKLIKSESPIRDLTTGEKQIIETRYDIIRADSGCEIVANIGKTGERFSSYTIDGGATWTDWHNDLVISPFVRCSTDKDTAEKKVIVNGFDMSDGSLISVYFENRQNVNETVTLKVNDYDAKEIRCNVRKLSKNAWSSNTLIMLMYEQSSDSFQIVGSNSHIRGFIDENTSLTDVNSEQAAVAYGDGYTDFAFINVNGCLNWTFNEYYYRGNFNDNNTSWYPIIDTIYSLDSSSNVVASGEFVLILNKDHYHIRRCRGRGSWKSSNGYLTLYGIF